METTRHKALHLPRRGDLGTSTSRPMMAMDGSGRSHGATLAQAIAGGLVHNSTNVVATINCRLVTSSLSTKTYKQMFEKAHPL